MFLIEFTFAINLAIITFMSPIGNAEHEVEFTLAEYIEEQQTANQQKQLKELGWYTGEVDGIYGPLTEQAIENFAEEANVNTDSSAITLALEENPVEKPLVEPAPATPSTSWSIDWDALAECESHGEWDYGPHSNWGNGLFEGGLQFQLSTWTAFKPAGYPEHAYQATKAQQIAVAEIVLEAQGLRAWPTCTKKLGMR